MNVSQDSLVLKSRAFPDIDQQVRIWNSLFPEIGDIDRRTLEKPVPDQSIRVCFPKISSLSEESAYIYGILRIREALEKLCGETNATLHDDGDFFHPETLQKEKKHVQHIEKRFGEQKSNLIVASVQFWVLRLKENSLNFPDDQIPMSISHASALLCVVQGGPRKLWGGGFENCWFCCFGSPLVYGGPLCFDVFEEDLCITPREHLGKSNESGGAASVFVG